MVFSPNGFIKGFASGLLHCSANRRAAYLILAFVHNRRQNFAEVICESIRNLQ
jgi:hypothetical protein